MHIRSILPGDNAAIAAIIRAALTEFGANKPGTVFYDESTDHLFELFQTEKSFYLIAETEGKVVGGCGIFPTEGLPPHTAELVKMYIDKDYRKLGLGRLLIEKCIEKAAGNGFKQIYLETMPELKKAVSVYEKFGFEYLPAPLGNSGHFGCDIWMIKIIKN
ncbi:GNAT family N-acetyltransferase [Gynurincola endophyticus]|jgi:putative acetyltransferase|uniref:GNAT family N-acetyltransferase n=1 Tax=Gynurincola endophyticus TaxID=2479004 RepID=UPI000F8E7AEF|nr:GNAT family N-acetyltransferase [Gynurincola endophyticus]